MSDDKHGFIARMNGPWRRGEGGLAGHIDTAGDGETPQTFVCCFNRGKPEFGVAVALLPELAEALRMAHKDGVDGMWSVAAHEKASSLLDKLDKLFPVKP